MPEIALPAKEVLVATLTAAAVMWFAVRGTPSPWRRRASWSWAIGAGVLAASAAAGEWPHWPALEDRARFLTVLVPLCLAVETLASAVRSYGVAWLLRLALAAVVAPILLHNTVYVADLDGPGSRQWSPVETAMILCGLAALLALVWSLMSRLESRTSTPVVQWVLFLDALATAATVILSGYFGGGLLGLGLAASMAGATLASNTSKQQSPAAGSLGMSVVGIFAVLLMGRFFGALSTSLAACLLFAPLLAWTFELPWLRKLAPAWRESGRLVCVVIPLVLAVVVAQRKFTAASKARSRPATPSAAGDP